MPINMLKMLKAMTISVNTLKMLDAYESNFLYNAYKMPLYFNSVLEGEVIKFADCVGWVGRMPYTSGLFVLLHRA